jgi:hypothetical protein
MRLERLVDNTPEVTDDIALLHFTFIDYRATHAHFRQLDMLLLAFMAVIFVFLSSANTALAAVGAFVLTLVPLFSLVVAIDASRPYLDGHEWKSSVRIGALLVTALAALLNYVTACTFDLHGCKGNPTMVQVLAIIVVCSAAGLLLLLAVSFWRVLLKGAEVEASCGSGRRKPMQPLSGIVYATGGNPLVLRADSRDRLQDLSSAPRRESSPHGAPLKRKPLSMLLSMKPSQRRIATGGGTSNRTAAACGSEME